MELTAFQQSSAPCIDAEWLGVHIMLDANMLVVHKGTMTLDEYLRKNDETDTAFAARVGISQSHVGRLRRGWKPSWDAIVAIERATDGNVQPNDWPRETEARVA